MAYLRLHDLKLPAGNIKRAKRATLLIPVGFVTWLVALQFHLYSLLTVSIVISGAGALLGMFFAVPMVMVGVAVLLAPVVVYFYADDRAYPILHAWWYWVGCAGCVSAWIWTLVDADSRYPRKSASPNQPPQPTTGLGPGRG